MKAINVAPPLPLPGLTDADLEAAEIVADRLIKLLRFAASPEAADRPEPRAHAYTLADRLAPRLVRLVGQGEAVKRRRWILRPIQLAGGRPSYRLLTGVDLDLAIFDRLEERTCRIVRDLMSGRPIAPVERRELVELVAFVIAQEPEAAARVVDQLPGMLGFYPEDLGQVHELVDRIAEALGLYPAPTPPQRPDRLHVGGDLEGVP